MYRELIINVTDHETRVALLEDGAIVELFIKRIGGAEITGNIYKGRVQRVLPGMQAAFVDIGIDQAAFIHVDDLIAERLDGLFLEEEECAEEPRGERGRPGAGKPQLHIEDLITEGREIMVYVSKSPIGTKGARISSHISLPGRFLVLMTNSPHIGISRRIEDDSERKRLKQIVEEKASDDFGYIVRTAAEGVNEDKISYEMAFLKSLYKDIQEKYQKSSAPALLHKELTVSLRAVRDLLTREADKLVIDSEDGYKSVVSFIETYMPSMNDSVELYRQKEPIFDAFNLEGDISRALKRKVWLKSGGYIVIEHTEALVAVDVNTGRYVGKYNLEETILKTNLEAVREIAYQIRLRDIGGIIIIDFIDMDKKSNQEKVFNALKKELKKDRSKTNVLPISEMGLVQMTRKRTRKPLTRILCEPCFYCEGEGYLVSRETICNKIYNAILSESVDMMGSSFTLQVNPEIAEMLHGEAKHIIENLERKFGKQIVIYPNGKLHMEEFDIYER